MKRDISKCIISKEKREDLFYKVDNEGFGYYMTQYGPDLDVIAKLGFDEKQLSDLCDLMSEVEEAISEYDGMFNDEEEEI